MYRLQVTDAKLGMVFKYLVIVEAKMNFKLVTFED